MKYIALVIALFALALQSPNVSAHQGGIISQTEVDAETAKRIYMGQSRALIGVNLPESNAARQRFEEVVLGRSPEQLRAHWSRLQFTGRATPLREVDSDQAVIDFVRSSEHAIGYISDISLVDGSLHIITTF